MKKIFILLAFLPCVLYAQENNLASSKWEMDLTAKIGFAKVVETGQTGLNGFINGGEALLNYKIAKNWNLQSGIGFFEFTANRIIENENVDQKNTYLQIPINYNSNYVLYKSKTNESGISLNFDLGIYANTLLKQELATVTNTVSDKNLGWNFGLNTRIGMKFQISDLMNFGMGLESQADISKAKNNTIERKIDNLNAVYFRFGFAL